MKFESGKLIIAATDLSNYLACKHLTELSRKIAMKELVVPVYDDPMLEVLRQRGLEHETSYVDHLQTQGLSVANLKEQSMTETINAMQAGVDVIVQAKFEGDSWRGYPDILMKVHKPSRFGSWSYEVRDTKLSQNTKAGTILQLCFYSDFLETLQGTTPEKMSVIKPGVPFVEDAYRYLEFKAYYTFIKGNILLAVQEPQDTYPEPVEHCNICNYWQMCSQQRRKDDHLSLVAGIRTSQINALRKQQLNTLTHFAEAKELGKPEVGDYQNLLRKQEQAKIQLEGREEQILKHKVLPVAPVDNLANGKISTVSVHGFNLMPEPSAGDIYFDFEGDAYYEGGSLEYLFGYVYRDEHHQWVYEKLWARNREEEKQSFIQFIQFVTERISRFPDLHIYHYAPYEPTAIKRLMHVHAICEEEVNNLLRANRFIDLHTIIKKSLIASVERYSLKDMEKLAHFVREVPLEDTGKARRAIEYALELRKPELITEQQLDTVILYNKDDCMATLALHQWLEKIRSKAEKEGATLTRFVYIDDSEGENQNNRSKEILAVVESLKARLPGDRSLWNNEHHGIWLLIHQLEYFRRERESAWWEFFATKNKDEDELKEDRKAIVGLSYLNTLAKAPKQRTFTHCYTFPEQETEIKIEDVVIEIGGREIGDVIGFSREDRILKIQHRQDSGNIFPYAVQVKPKTFDLTNYVIKVAKEVITHGLGETFPYPAIRDLLLKNKPRFQAAVDFSSNPLQLPGEDHVTAAVRLAKLLDNSVLPIQGPPGTGKTYTGAEMIIALVKMNKRIGITAVSHKAIRNLLAKVHERAQVHGLDVRLGHKDKVEHPDHPAITMLNNNHEVIAALDKGTVVGGTAWAWAVDMLNNNLTISLWMRPAKCH